MSRKLRRIGFSRSTAVFQKALLVFLVLAGTLACDGDEDVADVVVTPPSVSLVVGETQQFSATPVDRNGNALDRRVSWSSSDPSVAPVDGNGLVTGVAAGSVTITATSEGKSGTASVEVMPVPVAEVEVSPSSDTVKVGQTLQLTATTRDRDGNELTDRSVSWSSSDPSVAPVDGNGLVTGVAVGSVTITATSEGKSGTATITVTGPDYAGDWSGTTSQGKSISFVIVDNAFVSFEFEWVCGWSSGRSKTTYDTPRPIQGDTFTISGSRTGFSYRFDGKFESSTAASGTGSFTSNGCSRNVTWSAKKT